MNGEPTQVNEKAATAVPVRTRFALPWPTLVALAALLLSVWQWWDNRQQYSTLQQELARRLSEADGAMKQSSQIVQRSNESVAQAQTKLAALETKIAESQNQQVALEAMYQELSRNRDEWSLTEIEQILSIAAQQLQLAGNIPGALTALQTADNRLQRIDKPQLAPLRQVIDQDIQTLKAMPFIDLTGMAVKLDNIIASVDTLPLLSEARAIQQDESVPAADKSNSLWDRWTGGFWKEIRQLVRLQNIESNDVPLLSPNQTFFLRENLRLRLLTARLALLRHDEATYKSDLKASRDWLNRYFDTANRNVRNEDAVLRQLIDSSINITIPDISGSMEAVRNYKLTSREKPTQ